MTKREKKGRRTADEEDPAGWSEEVKGENKRNHRWSAQNLPADNTQALSGDADAAAMRCVAGAEKRMPSCCTRTQSQSEPEPEPEPEPEALPARLSVVAQVEGGLLSKARERVQRQRKWRGLGIEVSNNKANKARWAWRQGPF